MRNSFIKELCKLNRAHESIILVVGDLGFSVVEPFLDEFPNNFINAGVAEQNMTGLAAGMASEGYQVFTYSIANFPTFRCAEQFRNDVDYQNIGVTVVTVGGGLAYGALGYSHHAIQDYALMRTMPNTLILSPGDPYEVISCMRYLNNNPQPSYLRLGKAGEKILHKDIPDLKPGIWSPVSEVNDHEGIILSTGAALQNAIQMQKKQKYRNFSVYSLPLWGMSSKEKQIEQLSKIPKLITIEDHLEDGGFGSWMLEATKDRKDLLNKIEIISLNPKVCGLVGSQDYLNKEGGIIK